MGGRRRAASDGQRGRVIHAWVDARVHARGSESRGPDNAAVRCSSACEHGGGDGAG
jgi:hypothetical protein